MADMREGLSQEPSAARVNAQPVSANTPGTEPLADPLKLYTTARSATAAPAGFYNHNVRLDTPAGPVIVRIPIDGADVMDLRIWPEHEVMRAIEPYVPAAPRVLHVFHAAPPFQVHQCVDGVLLDATAPRGVPVPGLFTDDAAELFDRLGRVPVGDLPPLPRGWADDGDTPAFARQLSDATGGVWDRFRHSYGPLYAALGVPSDPLAPVLDGWAALTPRPFRLLHCDVHRKNVIVCPDGHAAFLDWELALWGDPVYDLAVHLHKMTYVEAEERRLLDSWSSLLPAAATRAWESDLARYLVHERIKSVLVDTVRYTKLIADLTADPARTPESLVRSLTTKLNAAGAIWGWVRPTDEERVEQAVHGFLQEQT